MGTQTQRVVLKGEDKTRAAFESAKRRMRDLGIAGVSLTTVLKTLGFVGFGALVKRTLDFGNRVQKLALRLGTTTQFVSQMAFVFQRANIGFQQGAIGLQRMTRRLGQAAKGSGEATDALNELGINATSLGNLPLREQFLTVAEALSRVENASNRTTLAQKIFDSEGVQLLQTMEDGAAGLIEMMQRSDELGKTLTDVAANDMAAAQDAMTNLKSVGEGLSQGFTARIAPAITVVGNALSSILFPAIDLVVAGVTSIIAQFSAFGSALAALMSGDVRGALMTLKEESREAALQFEKDFEDAIDSVGQRFGNLDGTIAGATDDAADTLLDKIRKNLGRSRITKGGKEAEDPLITAAKGLIGTFGGDKDTPTGPTPLQTQSGTLNIANLRTPVTKAAEKQVTLLEQIEAQLKKIAEQRALSQLQAALAT